jgi:hypothetical protein
MKTINLKQQNQFNSTFKSDNPGVSIAQVNITQTDQLKALNKTGGHSESDFRDMLATQQRVARLHPDEDVQNALLSNNIHSAQQVTQLTKRQFANTYKDPLGISAEEADKLHDNATAITENVRHLTANIATTIASPAYNALKATNVGGDTREHFQNLPSYQELFGSLDYCECEECKSIFGPAAYFVDLMRIIDKYVTTPNSSTIPSGLTLGDRRPDLAQIVLSCNNTTQLLPYIQIVIERLSALVVGKLGITAADLPKSLATTVNYPFNTPFNLPLTTITVLLDQLNLKLENIYAMLGVDAATVARESLGINPDQNAILTTAASGDTLAGYYGYPSGTDLNTTLNNTVTFQQSAGINAGDLYNLLNQNLSTAEQTAKLAHNFFINQGYASDGYLAIKADSTPPVFNNPTEDVFDRLNRFLRLAQYLSLSYAELDWLLRVASGTTTVSIDATSEENLAGMLALAQTFDSTAIQLAPLYGPIQTYGEGSDDASASQFDVVFNNSALLNGNAPYHPKQNPLNATYDSDYKNWTPGSTADTAVTAYLSGALNLNIQDLNALGVALFSKTATNLTVVNLSSLYRHTLLAQLLTLTITQYLKLLSFFSIAGTSPFSIEQVNELQAYAALMNRAGYTVYDLDYFINDTASSYAQPVYQDSTVQDWLTSLWLGNIPSETSKQEAYVTGAMANYLGTSQNMIGAISSIFTQAIALPNGISHWSTAFLTAPQNVSSPSEYQTYIDSVLSLTSRWLELINKLSLPYQQVSSIGQYPASYGFDAANMAAYNCQQVADAYTFKMYFNTYADPQYQLLDYIAAVNNSDANALSKLVAVTGWNLKETAALVPLVASNQNNLVTQISQLAAGINVLSTLHADTQYLTDLKTLASAEPASAWDSYINMATQTQQQIQSIYTSDQWQGVFNQINGKIDLQFRDALLSIALWQLSKTYIGISTPASVYEFMLIDVEMGDITQISYVKEALNACQLYLQRVRLKLEEGIDVLDIPEAFWQWIMQYRYWEDNRLIYVYPENYLLPSLRHTKTELFQNLENNLQQSQITDAYVEQAYTEYINDFATLAKLTPVESLDTLVNDPEKGEIRTLYVVARSQTQPYTFYIASQEESYPWTQWSEIKVTINASYVTPVFVFNRLYIFWIELNKSVGSSITTTSGSQDTKSNNSVTCKVDIKCSFQDLLGKWVNAQIIKQDEVVYYTVTDNTGAISGNQPFQGLFDMNGLPWLKLQAIPFNNTNLSPLEQKGQSFEALCLQYGPYLADSTSSISVTKTVNPVSDDQIFDDLLYQTGQNFNRQLQAYQSGRLPLITTLILDSDLMPSLLYRRNEFYYIDTYQPAQKPISYQALANTLNDSLDLVYSTDVIYDNYLAGFTAGLPANSSNNQLSGSSFTSATISKQTSTDIFNALKTAGVLDSVGSVVVSELETLDLVDALSSLLGSDATNVHPNQFGEIQKVLFLHATSVNLLSTIESARSQVKAVQNRPGSFIFNSSEESFLFQPQAVNQKPAFSSLGKSVVARRTRTDKSTFMQMGLTYEQSGAIVNQLSEYNFLTSDGYLKTTDDLKNNLEFVIQTLITNGQIPNTVKYQSVYFILMGFPIVFEDIFITTAIDSGQSVAIYQAFAVYNLIDSFGRVDLDNLTGANANLVLGNLLLQEKIYYKQVSGIYETLYYAPSGYGMAYTNSYASTNTQALDDYKFTTTRLSTRAIDPLSRSLLFGGVDGLLKLQSQQIPVIPVIPFDQYGPNASQIIDPKALDGTQVDFEGLYGEYFWEIFYHIPVLIANTLGTAQNFSYAKKWYTYIINPSVKEQFIAADTFATQTQDLIATPLSGEVLTSLQGHETGSPAAAIVNSQGVVNPQFTAEDDLSFLTSSPTSLSEEQVIMVRNVLLNYQLATASAHYWQFQPFRTHTLESLRNILSDNNPAIAVYNDDPFDPHAIARLRIGAYEKYTLMQYIDNLIKWGDMLFTQDSWESITEATLMYVYAYDMLGPRPQMLGTCDSGQDATFADIKQKYSDNIPQFLIELENILPPTQGGTLNDQGFNDLGTYFCVPDNSKLITYWDIIEDRLYKIRHSMNIDGVVRQLALFQPPIDPLALAKAAAAGNNLLGYNDNQQASLAPYRFQTMMQQAKQITNSAISLGNALLAALEKQDAAKLEILHNTQEKVLLDMSTSLRQNAIEQLQQNLQANQTALTSSQYQESYYQALLGKGLNSAEETNLSAMEAALVFNMLGSVLKTSASIGYAVPQVGSPFAMTYGGQQIGNAVNAAAGVAEIGSEISSYIAQRALTMAGYQRRSEEWTNQQTMANYQSQRIQQEIEALQIQIKSANQELSINKKQIAQNQDINDFLTAKFTNQQLYSWMAGQLSGVLYQTYLLGLDFALKAQQAYQQELDSKTSFVNFNYWDNLHKGLLSGEHLMQALDQMEASYLENHARRLEIEKTVSLAATNPEQFLELKANGSCTFHLTEEMFDYDFPGHYLRKIKSITISIPAIVGPYQHIHATLTQTYSAYVNDPQAHDAVTYLLANRQGKEPSSGLVQSSQISSITLSRGVDDSGLFVLNLDDPRYLPFEERGVVSDWTLSLPKETNWFDFNSISDVIIHINYTAKADGGLETYVKQQLAQHPYQGGIYYNLGQSFAAQWQSFINDHSDSQKQTFNFPINAQALTRFDNLQLTEVVIHLITAEGISLPASSQFITLTIVSQAASAINNVYNIGQVTGLTFNVSQIEGDWQLAFDLETMKSNANLAPLLKDGFIDADELLGVEMTYLYNGKIFT